ncbi:MAG: 4Fe-4S binding protein [Methanophagales archaeon]|nr:4Fe-4S binding protein [Methanophagales archaeon]MCW3141296.1 4Fe-4S binding protein [Methanophagales archaeon]
MQQPLLLIWKACVDENLCVGCGKCTEVCWAGAIRVLDKKAVIDVNRCICCTICMRTCPRGAIRMIPYSFQTLQREDVIKAQLKEIGAQLGEMERSIGKL